MSTNWQPIAPGMRGEIHTTDHIWPGYAACDYANYDEIDICPRCKGDKYDAYSELCSACVAELRGIETDARAQARKLANHRAHKAEWLARIARGELH